MRLYSVDLGVKRIKIPVAQFGNKGSNIPILVTAGLDGDEYAGIEAAYTLIEEFDQANNITIIPIVNVPGFEAETSYNPYDHKYPKFVIPGKKDGTSTDRLMHWLYENYISRSILWIDMHGGAINENLIPFMSLYAIRNRLLTSLYNEIYTIFKEKEIILFQKKSSWRLPNYLSHHGIGYILSEAGQRGQRDDSSIQLHKQRVKTILQAVDSLFTHKKTTLPHLFKDRYQHISIVNATKTGLWKPIIDVGQLFGKNQIMGGIISFDYRIKTDIKAPVEGRLLWRKNSMYVTKGEELGGFSIYD